MSMRLELLQVARLAPRLLGESAPLVKAFLLRQQNADGGFKDRSGRSDLYYTVFGIDGLLALESRLPPAGVHGQIPTLKGQAGAEWMDRAAVFLEKFGDGSGLDFVHLCCLARAWTA